MEIERELKERPLEEDILSYESDHLPKEKIVTDSKGETNYKENWKGKEPTVEINFRPKFR